MSNSNNSTKTGDITTTNSDQYNGIVNLIKKLSKLIINLEENKF
jgi:hypothetical protein